MKILVLLSAQLFYVTCCVAQTSSIKNLVFEGAGIRGIGYGGAIQYLEEKRVLTQVEKVGGASAGAITAALLSVGYNAQEITNIITTTKFQKFNFRSGMMVGGIIALKRNYGYYSQKKFIAWLEQLIANKVGNPNITFEQLYNNGAYKDLYVTATSLCSQKNIVLSRHTYPKMRVVDAVAISCCIPLYFEAVKIDSMGHVLNKSTGVDYADILVDGGLGSNYPINLFDSLPNSSLTQQQSSTLGWRMDTPIQIQENNGVSNRFPIRNIKNFVTSLYYTSVERLNKYQLTNADWERTIQISDNDLSPRIRRLPKQAINGLLTNGYEQTKSWFEKRSSL
jgi:NTE family protein